MFKSAGWEGIRLFPEGYVTNISDNLEVFMCLDSETLPNRNLSPWVSPKTEGLPMQTTAKKPLRGSQNSAQDVWGCTPVGGYTTLQHKSPWFCLVKKINSHTIWDEFRILWNPWIIASFINETPLKWVEILYYKGLWRWRHRVTLYFHTFHRSLLE